MNLDRVQGALEALLFVATEPVPVDKLSRVLGVSEAVVREALRRLVEECRAERRGLEPVEAGGGWQLVTKADYARAVEQLVQPRRQGLSQAALETLAIIAYRQPVTRAEIDAVRGVQSEAAVRTLLERGLIREVGRKEAPGRPILYGTTPLFLQQFGLRDLTELPPPEQFRAAAAGGDRPDRAGSAPGESSPVTGGAGAAEGQGPGDSVRASGEAGAGEPAPRLNAPGGSEASPAAGGSAGRTNSHPPFPARSGVAGRA